VVTTTVPKATYGVYKRLYKKQRKNNGGENTHKKRAK